MAECFGKESSDPSISGGVSDSHESDVDCVEQDGIEKFVLAGDRTDLMARGRIKLDVYGRTVALFYHKGQFYALDQHCYHAGGPLEQGDIEEIGDRMCVVCPWHRIKITLDTGEGLYFSIDPKDLKKPKKLCSKGVKQRIHHVKVEQEKVYVALSDTSTYRESDHYQEYNYFE